MRRSAVSIPLAVVIAVYLLATNGAFANFVSKINGLEANDTTKVTVPSGAEIRDASPLVPPTFGEDPKTTTTTKAPSGTTEPDPLAGVDLDPTGRNRGLTVIDTDAERQAALAVIGEVRTAGRGPKTGYSRDEFGSAWTDDNGAGLFSKNGCDTRNDILRRDLTGIEVRPKTKDCVIVAGKLDDPYTGKTYTFVKAEAAKLQVDHVVPLSLAWQMGAARWDVEKRTAFANDPLNLVLTDGPTNGSKSDSSIASWLPPSKAFRCMYAVRIAQVSLRYDLPATPADKDAMAAQCAA